MSKVCVDCEYFERTFWLWVRSGASVDGCIGKCMLNPKPVKRREYDTACRYFK